MERDKVLFGSQKHFTIIHEEDFMSMMWKRKRRWKRQDGHIECEQVRNFSEKDVLVKQNAQRSSLVCFDGTDSLDIYIYITMI